MRATLDSIQLRLEQDNGMQGDRQMYTTKTISNIKEDATNDGLLAISDAVSALSQKQVLNTKRVQIELITHE